MKFHEYIKKLQNLSEKKKLIIIFTIVIIVGLIMGFFWIKSAANSISTIGRTFASADLPKIDVPQDAIDSLSDIKKDVVDSINEARADNNLQTDDSSAEALATEDWKTYTNSPYGFEIKYPSNWNLDKNHTTDFEFHLLKEVEKEEAVIDVEMVSQTRKTTSAEAAIDKIIKKMRDVIKPKEKIIIGNNSGYEAIGTLCTAICDGSSDDVYSPFSIIYFSNSNQVFYVDYIEGVTGLGWKNDVNNWKYYDEFKNIISTFKFTN